MLEIVVYDSILEFDTLSLEQKLAKLSQEANETIDLTRTLQDKIVKLVGQMQADEEVKSLAKSLAKAQAEYQALAGGYPPPTSEPDSTDGVEQTRPATEPDRVVEEPSPRETLRDNLGESREKQLKKLFRALAAVCHPDSPKSDKETRRVFPLVEEGYRTGNIVLLQQILEGITEYLSAKKSNSKRKGLLKQNLKKIHQALQRAKDQLAELKHTDGFKLLTVYDSGGLASATAMHKAILKAQLDNLNTSIAHLKLFSQPRSRSIFYRVLSSTTNYF